MSVLKEEYSIDDFDEADFLNPISLLAALQKYPYAKLKTLRMKVSVTS